MPPITEIGGVFPEIYHRESFRDFVTELELVTVDDLFYGQLFGRANPFHNEVTPEPRLDPQRYREEGTSGWIDLATFRQASMVFNSYYAVRVEDLRDLSFASLTFTAQS